MLRTARLTTKTTQTLCSRAFHRSRVIRAKGDESTIDSFKLPSQTSINEWEFKYDFIPRTEPKVPPVSKEAVKQDIAQEKAKHIERELFAKEANSSVKVEANSATVVHGGESVSEEPEFLHDHGSTPVDSSLPLAKKNAARSKPANRDQYIQTSINPNINQNDVINLGEREVDHKTASVDKQTPVVEDNEHEDSNHQGQPKQDEPLGPIPLVVGLFGVGGVGYYFYNRQQRQA